MTGMENVRDLGVAFSEVLSGSSTSFLAFILNLAVAILILIVGYHIAKFVGYIIQRGIHHLSIDMWFEKTAHHKSLGGLELSKVGGGMAKWVVFAMFLSFAFGVATVAGVSDVMLTIADVIPSAVIAVILVLLGVVVADIVDAKLMHAKKIGWITQVAPAIKFVIIFMFIYIALERLGLNLALSEMSYNILLAGVVLTVSIALGISFGFAMKDQASDVVKVKKKRVTKKRR